MAPSFTFYATFDVNSVCSYIPENTAVLLPASSYARKGLKCPNLPPHVTDKGADSGGFVASRIWGEYRYTLDQYTKWLGTWSPLWAATMDYCCEPELNQVTQERQDKTTTNIYAAWERCRNVSWAWVPTIQGLYPDDYRRHAYGLKEIIGEMQQHYRDNPAWRVGIGTLCRRNDVATIHAILEGVREIFPDVPLHLWGIKLDALRSIDLENVVSTDSAAWHGNFMRERHKTAQAASNANMSKRRYTVTQKLPRYIEKVHLAYTESRNVFSSQLDESLLIEVETFIQSQGWTINIRTRRNRTYVYASKRQGQEIKQTYLGPVSKINMLLSDKTTRDEIEAKLKAVEQEPGWGIAQQTLW